MLDTASMAGVALERTQQGVLLVRLSGNWREGPAPSGVEMLQQALSEGPPVKALEFDTAGLTGWDSRFVALVGKCIELVCKRDIGVRYAGLPAGVQRLLVLAGVLTRKGDTRPPPVKPSFLVRLGERTIVGWEGTVGLFTFLGQSVLGLVNLLRGRAQFRWADTVLVMEQCGPQALAIVALINFLVGLIIAFIGSVELKKLGASIYVADLVGIATVREMACIMTGIILCGRTGAAFAAHLGTMKLNEEIDALQTFGISPIEFLVLPRMIALMLVMPFLCVFADLVSIAGGYLVSVSTLGMTSAIYLSRTGQAIQIKTFLLGIFKGCFFGFLVAYTGCLRGMQSGYTASAVGQAATRAVVAGITSIIASDGVFAVLCNALHI